ncbi:MAG: hypothetical protein JEY99_03970 [Spirochaetales bacterium]|nr:hypothetical protein [Spirochaetales bacterium]
MILQNNFDSKVEYVVEVAGSFGSDWRDWLDKQQVSLVVISSEKSTLTGVFDQAGLIGFIRRLYYMRLPLLSVNRFESVDQEGEIV